MHDDDRQVGRILGRREVLKVLGVAGAAVPAGCGPSQPASTAQPPGATTAQTAAAAPNAEAQTAAALGNNTTAVASASAEAATAVAANATMAAANGTAVPSCVVRPEVTEGPYYVAEDLVRSDIRSDPGTSALKAGTPLVLTFNVSQVSNGSCSLLKGATVEVWHCDAAGQYSDVSDRGFNTKGQKWLRGAQVTDAQGVATFTTIYPGWYRGRAVHIHFKVHPDTSKVFTSQLFFDDKLSDQVFTQAPYASKGQRDVLNSNDNIYKGLLLLTVTKTAQGYATTFPIGISM